MGAEFCPWPSTLPTLTAAVSGSLDPGGLDDFVDLVIPELQERGLFRTEYEGTTLRENLGLDRPVSRYAGAAD